MTQAKKLTPTKAQIDTLWNPQDDETVLWQGAPDAMVLARSAFHTPIVAGYFAVMAVSAIVLGGGLGGALATVAAGASVLAILHGIAFMSARTTRYILTDRRIILRIGMAIEKTVNLPLPQIGAAHLSEKGGGFGEIALEPTGEHTLGYLLLWPHARPWRFSRPQPMLRALPEAARVAEMLAAAVAAHEQIARGEDATGQATRPTMQGAMA